MRGKPGLAVVGEAEVDGRRHPLAGTVPVNFTFEGKHLKFALVRDEGKDDEPIEVLVRVDEKLYMSARVQPGAVGEIFSPVLLPSVRQRGVIGAIADADTYRRQIKR